MCVAVRLTRDEEIAAFNAGDFDLLIMSVLPLASKIGRGIAKAKNFDQDEGVSLAQLAVCKSIRKFDPNRGFRLTTFIWRCAASYVRHHIDRQIQRNPAYANIDGGAVAAPESKECLREEKKLYWQAIKQLGERDRLILERRRAGHTFRQISKEIGVGPSHVATLYKSAINKIRSTFPVM